MSPRTSRTRNSSTTSTAGCRSSSSCARKREARLARTRWLPALARNPEGQGFRTAAGIMADKRRVNAYYGAVSLLAILQDQRAVGFAKAGELREANDHFEDALRLNDHFYQAGLRPVAGTSQARQVRRCARQLSPGFAMGVSAAAAASAQGVPGRPRAGGRRRGKTGPRQPRQESTGTLSFGICPGTTARHHPGRWNEPMPEWQSSARRDAR